MDTIEFEYALSDYDIEAVGKFITRRLWRKWRTLLLLLTAGSCVLFLFWLNSTDSGFTALTVGMVAGVLLMNFMILLSHARNYVKRWKSIPALREPLKTAVTTEGLTIRAVTSATTRRWANFQTFSELEHHFLLIQGEETPVVFLPKRAFAGKVGEVRTLISSNLPQK